MKTWIDVNDELPDSDEEILWKFIGNGYVVGRYNKEENHVDVEINLDDFISYTITSFTSWHLIPK